MSKMFPTTDKDGKVTVKISVQEMIGLITVLSFAKNAYGLLTKQEYDAGSEESAQLMAKGHEVCEGLLNHFLDETKVNDPENKQLN